jgi:hypothetical protein
MNVRQKKFDARCRGRLDREEAAGQAAAARPARIGSARQTGRRRRAKSFERALVIDPSYYPAPRISRDWTSSRRSRRTR